MLCMLELWMECKGVWVFLVHVSVGKNSERIRTLNTDNQQTFAKCRKDCDDFCEVVVDSCVGEIFATLDLGGIVVMSLALSRGEWTRVEILLRGPSLPLAGLAKLEGNKISMTCWVSL